MNKFDPTKPVRCRDMSDIAKAEIVRTDMGGICPILTVITYGDGTKNHARHTADGRFYEGREHALDLINVPEKRKVWVNINSSGSTYGYQCREVADEMADSRRIACKELEYYEGEGLEGGGE